MTRLRRMLIIAVVAGIIAGAAFALLHRQDAPRAVAAVGDVSHEPPAAPSALRLGAPREVELSRPTTDPGGGPPWILRTFATRLVADPLNPGVWRCVQLGRQVGVRFGWIVPGRAFRRAAFNMSDTPIICSSPRDQRRGFPEIGRVVLLNGPRLAQGVPAATITWGRLGRPLAGVTLSDGTDLRPNAARAVLAVRSGDAPSWTRGTARYVDGHSRVFHSVAVHERYPLNSMVVAARAPDPTGGPPWAVLHPRGAPRTCLIGPGRLVGRHLGLIDAHLGIFWPDVQPATVTPSDRVLLRDRTVPIAGRCPHAAHRLTAARPAAIDVRVAYLHDEDPVGRIQLRQPDGRTIAFGATAGNVASVTIPGGRTLIPSPGSHAVMSVEPGTAPAGYFGVAARLRDGSGRFWSLQLPTG